MASRGSTAKQSHMFVADFETCDSSELSSALVDDKPLYKQRVWLAGHKNLDTMKTVHFNNIDEFMTDVLSRGGNQNKEYGFHNLKFDGSYIVPWLLNNGYFSTNQKPKPKEFGVLVTERNDWYSITVQVTKRRKVTLWDTAKLFPMKLEYLPQLYYTPTQKVQEPQSFYELKREKNHVPTERELTYFENDLQVLAEALNAHIDLVGLRFKKTQAGQAFYDFTQDFKAWKLRFPALDTEQDKDIRQAYWGGISHVQKQYKGVTLSDVRVMDINSSYPHKSAYSKLPYGECIRISEDMHPDPSKFWISDVLATFTLKENKLPCIPKKAISEGLSPDSDDPDKWLSESGGIVRLKLSSIDYQTVQQSYEFKIVKWVKSWHWKQRVHPELTAFIEKNNTVKVEAKEQASHAKTDAERFNLLAQSQRAKITNNGFYGKFGEEVIKEGKTPYLEDDTVIWEVDKIQELTDGKKKYLPVAIAITAYGRQQLVELANALGEDFIYCDTDSVHYLQKGQHKVDSLIKGGGLEVHPTKLGAWDLEGDYEKARFLRAKCYMEGNGDDIEATVAGLPADPHTGQFSKKRSSLTWDNFHIGHTVPVEQANKLRSVRTETGTKLIPVAFTITKHTNVLYN